MILTEKQQAIVDQLITLECSFCIDINYYRGKQDIFNLYIRRSSSYRKELLNIFHKLDKNPAYDDTITGKCEIEGMLVNCWDWDVCKIVGTIEVEEKVAIEYKTEKVTKKVTDCDLCAGKYKENEVTML